MKKDTMLTQCILKNDNRTIIVWIDSAKAVVGHDVLASDQFDKSDSKEWWEIVKVSNVRAPYDKIAGRKAEDIWENPINRMRGNK